LKLKVVFGKALQPKTLPYRIGARKYPRKLIPNGNTTGLISAFLAADILPALRESLKLVRAAAGLPDVGFHDLRHLFCSFSVMAGIDFMTIASWLGHNDGGILIGKVYGHLLDGFGNLVDAISDAA
jgi:integrase